MKEGYVKIYRTFLSWEWLDDPKMVSLFLYLILTTNHTKKTWHGIIIERGQCIISRRKLAKILGISEQSLRTCIDRLKSTREITLKSTRNYTLINVLNYEKFQENEKKSTRNSTLESTFHQPAINPPSTRTKELKNEKNENNINLQTVVCKNINPLLNLFKEINPSINFANKTQREALQDIINKFGYEKTEGIIKYAISIQGQKYAPVITTPLMLKNKLGEIMIYYKKENNKQTIII